MSSNSQNKRSTKNKSTTFPSTRRARPTSPNRRVSPPPSAATLLDGDLFTEFEALQISPESPNPRSFPYSVKQQCWEKAEKIQGRDPERWRRDPLGNTVFRKLVGCPGCLCHDYDHILPYSKGGKSTLENCQVLQLIDPRETGLRCPEVILFRRVLTVGSQVVIWTFLSCLPMAMFVVGKILAGVKFNNQLVQTSC